MKSVWAFLVFLALCVSLSWGQSAGKVVLVNSPDASGVLSPERLTQCLSQLAREWELPLRDLPNVMVFHVSKEVAEAASVRKDTAVRRNSGGESGQAYYEVWLVGKPEYKYVLALQAVLEYHFHFKPSDEQRDLIVNRVGRAQTYTVDAQEGK